MLATEDTVSVAKHQTPSHLKSLKNALSSSSINSSLTNKEQVAKERTLFCINIDQRCTEDILYELFLQVGPIENLTRKPDRNGNLICLITYKHVESCEYAIKLFNGISLFNQPLKVQQSQPNTSTNPSLNRSSSSNLNSLANQQQQVVNHYQHSYSRERDNREKERDRSRPANDNNSDLKQQHQQQNQQQQILQLMLQNLVQSPVPLMGNPLLAPSVTSLMGNFNNNSNTPFNRSRSGPNLQDFENDQNGNGQHNSRRNFDRSNNYSNGNNNYDQRRDSSRNNNFNSNLNSSRDSSYHNRHSISRDHHNNNNYNSNNKSRSRSRSPRRKNNRR